MFLDHCNFWLYNCNEIAPSKQPSTNQYYFLHQSGTTCELCCQTFLRLRAPIIIINNIINLLWSWFPGWFLLNHSFLFEKCFGYAWLQQCCDLRAEIITSMRFHPQLNSAQNSKMKSLLLKETVVLCRWGSETSENLITSFSGRANFFKHLKIIIIIIILIIIGWSFHDTLFIWALIPNFLGKT